MNGYPAAVPQLRQRAVEFDVEGLMRRREASIDDAMIVESERRYLGPRTEAEGGVDLPLH